MHRYYVSFSFHAHGNTRLSAAFVEVPDEIVDEATLQQAYLRIEWHKTFTILTFQKVA